MKVFQLERCKSLIVVEEMGYSDFFFLADTGGRVNWGVDKNGWVKDCFFSTEGDTVGWSAEDCDKA